MLSACLAVGAVQLLITLRFFLRSRNARAVAQGDQAPGAAVIVPCKGSHDRLAANAAAILEQEYPAHAEFIFVTPSRSDPAWNTLEEVLRVHPSVKAVLTASDAVPERCGEHILNKLHGVSMVSPAAEVLVFADSDVEAPPSWLRNMTGPLTDPSVGAVTAPLVFLPSGAAALCGNLRCAWGAAGIPYLDLTGCVAGASFAMLKSEFHGLGIDEIWKRSLSDDLSLTVRLKKAGKKVRMAYAAQPTSSVECGLGELTSMFNKWMVLFKFYFPVIWAPGAALTVFKIGTVLWGASGRGWLPAAAMFAMDAANIYFSLSALRAGRPGKFSGACLPAVSIMAAPLLQPLYAVNFAVSLFASKVRWSGYTYRIRSAESVTVEPDR